MISQHPTRITSALGVHGWSALDPVLLGALTLEAPVLLVGVHGTAKTLLVERVAAALHAEFRHYNASLLNYDDLVGIPLPDEANGLRFVGTPGAIWGASFVFFDEVNRCRADLQNKMFPIVHERRVAGLALQDLRHRWAAMNPPSLLDDIGGYSGVEPLDLALADRFWCVITVPDWSKLTRAERTALVAGVGMPSETLNLQELIDRTREFFVLSELELGDFATRYAVALVDLLAVANIEISGRRAGILRKLVIATHAATRTLNDSPNTRDVCELVLRNGLPQWAEPETPDLAAVIAAHAQAFEIASIESDSVKRRIFEERDPVRRVNVAISSGADDPVLATVMLGALASCPTKPHKIALAAVFTEAFRARNLTPAAWSAIHENAAPVFLPRETETSVAPGARLDAWRNAAAWLATDATATALERAIITACGPELLHEAPLEKLLVDLRGYQAAFLPRGAR